MEYPKLLTKFLRYVAVPIVLSVLWLQFEGTPQGKSSVSAYFLSAAMIFIPWYLLIMAIDIIHGGLTDAITLNKSRAFISWILTIVIVVSIVNYLAGGNDYGEIIPLAMVLSLVPIAVYYLTEIISRRHSA